jgi:hypothetical protein
MKTQSPDTERRAERVLVDLLRKKSVSEKFNQVRSLSRLMIQLSRRAVTRARKAQSETEADLLFVELNYGRELAERLEHYLQTIHHERSGPSTSGRTSRTSL